MSDESSRRATILEAAMRVFVRYGFKKTSMDDLARAAGLSRQGLYIHFATKEELFRAAVAQFIELLRANAKAALAREAPVEERLLAAFEAMHGFALADGFSDHVDELLETAETLVGAATREVEQAFLDDVARALRSSGVAAQWKELGLSAKDLAEHLQAASYGLKHSVSSLAEYRERMRVALRLVTRGAN